MNLTNETKDEKNSQHTSSWLKVACVVGCGFAAHYIYDKWKRYYYNYPPGPAAWYSIIRIIFFNVVQW